MLLCIDVGNTDIVLGVYSGEQLIHNWRLATSNQRTADEFGVAVHMLLQLAGRRLDELTDVAVSSVVPSVTDVIERACERYLKKKPLVVGPGIKTGMPIHSDNPREVGADRIVNAVAAYERVKGAAIVVDFGTATTFDCISARGHYEGGVIAPGIRVSMDALISRTAKLPRVDFVAPPSVIGKNTVHGIQSGLFYGYAAMVDGLARKISAELGGTPHVIATGGLAPLMSEVSEIIKDVQSDLTLEGLRIIHSRNR